MSEYRPPTMRQALAQAIKSIWEQRATPATLIVGPVGIFQPLNMTAFVAVSPGTLYRVEAVEVVPLPRQWWQPWKHRMRHQVRMRLA